MTLHAILLVLIIFFKMQTQIDGSVPPPPTQTDGSVDKNDSVSPPPLSLGSMF